MPFRQETVFRRPEQTSSRVGPQGPYQEPALSLSKGTPPQGQVAQPRGGTVTTEPSRLAQGHPMNPLSHSDRFPPAVIPANAGIQGIWFWLYCFCLVVFWAVRRCCLPRRLWIPACAGMTNKHIIQIGRCVNRSNGYAWMMQITDNT